MKRSIACLLMTSAFLLPACGGPDVVRPTVSVSVGQQLIDLKKARDSGAMSEREYASQKDQLIKNVD
jgi:hypothetical protein